MAFQKILAAVDYSPLSQSVFEQALELARTNQAKLMLFHCLTADTVTISPPFAGEFGVSPQFVNQAYQAEFIRLDQQVQQTQSMLRRFCETAAKQGVAAECGYRIVEPGQGLCQIAQQWGADLIMLGRRGRKGLREALLGSVSNYVLHNAPCAVLVIQANCSPVEKNQAIATASR